MRAQPQDRTHGQRRGWNVTALAAVASLVTLLPSIAAAATHDVRGDCDGEFPVRSDSQPVTYNVPQSGQPLAAFADATTQSVGAYARQGTADASPDCRISAGFSEQLTVRPGTSGLVVGDPVEVDITVDLSGTTDVAPGPGSTGNYYGRVQATARYSVTGDGFCGEGPCLLGRLSAGVYDEDGSLFGQLIKQVDEEIAVSSNTGDDRSDTRIACAGLACPSGPYPYDSGQQTFTVRLTVGETVTIAGDLEVRADSNSSSDGPAIAFADFLNSLHSVVVPAAGFAGVQLEYGAPASDPDDSDPPVVNATTAPEANAAGWHRDDVTVTLNADDGTGSGVASITYATAGAMTTGPTTVGADVAVVAIASEGTTTVTYRAEDAAGNLSEEQALVVRLDKTAPVLDLPSEAPVEATSPGGASVNLDVTAQDEIDPNPTLNCSPPSGSTFPIGATIATCTAGDVAGNESTGTVTVTVLGASDQLGNLVDDVLLHLDLSRTARAALSARLRPVVRALSEGDLQRTCGLLAGFETLVRALPARHLSDADRHELLTDADRIQAVLNCA